MGFKGYIICDVLFLQLSQQFWDFHLNNFPQNDIIDTKVGMNEDIP